LTIGSSTTDNMMITDGETWQDVLQRDLFAAGDTFYVANAGLNGHTSENNIEAFEYWFPSIPRFKPDYIIFMIGWVDLLTAPAPAVDENHPWITVFKSKSALWDFKRSITGWFTIKIPKSPLNPEKITWTETPLLDSAAYDTLLRDKLVAFKEKLIRLIELSRNLGAEPVFVTQPSVIWRNRNGILSGSDVANPFTEKEHAGVKINGVDTYHMARRQDRLIKKIADKYHAAFFDVVPDSNWTTTDWWDGVHFTPQGCKKLGDLLFQRLNSLIASREPATCPLRSGMNDRMAERSRI